MDHQLIGAKQLTSDAALAVQLDGAGDPVERLSRFADLPYLCLLQSAAPGHPLNRYSFLAADPVAVLSKRADAWPSVCASVRATIGAGRLPFPALPPLQGGWIGWLTYELGGACDRAAPRRRESLTIPEISLGLYDWVIAWDHVHGESWLISTGCDVSANRDATRARQRASMVLERWNGLPPMGPPARTDSRRTALHSDFTAESYQQAVEKAIQQVLAGNIFQVNLAQRFSAPFSGSSVQLYQELCRRTAAPMAAFIQHGAVHVLSASPERLVRFDPRTRHAETRPIKGTRPRHQDAAQDAILAQELQASEKDRAENVMIVDLARNDLARVCLSGSIRVPTLNALESHPTIHHLVSTVIGTLKPGCDALDLLTAAFPGGSITGAPKLRAMAVINDLEPVARGVYSGSIGWIGLDGGMDTSIAIRTVTIADGIAAFHAGGAITAQSNPFDEYRETLDKARALIAAVTGE
ncbi:MAG: anthranilate synthase component I family protein [Gemmatimonadales bacterium]